MIGVAPKAVDGPMLIRSKQMLFVAVMSLIGSLCHSGEAQAQATDWVGTWAAAPVVLSPKIDATTVLGTAEYTLRQTVRLSRGGKTVRLALSNEFGIAPLVVSATHIALASGVTIRPGSDVAVLFAGKSSVTIPPGAFIQSDPVTINVADLGDLPVSLCVPLQSLSKITGHALGNATTFVADGNQTSAETLAAPVKVLHSYLIKDVEISADRGTVAIVTQGDSITDGAHSAPDENHRWPDFLAARLAHNKLSRELSVMNEGISGNRILQEGTGPSALDRFNRDVLHAPGVRYVIWLEGINDIGRSEKPRVPGDTVTASLIVDGMKKAIALARGRGLTLFGATITPDEGAKYFTPQGEAMRQTVNAFIRQPGNFDGIIDFERAIQDSQHPTRLLAVYDCGDHLHPNDAGYQAMADAIDLKTFR